MYWKMHNAEGKSAELSWQVQEQSLRDQILEKDGSGCTVDHGWDKIVSDLARNLLGLAGQGEVP